MTTLMNGILGLATLGALGVLGACSHDGPTDPPPHNTDAISDLVHVPAATSSSTMLGQVVAAASQIDQSDVVYVSLPPGTLPTGRLATVRNPRTGNSAIVRLDAGGFDPLPMAARAGDVLELTVVDGANASVYTANLVVPRRKPPHVVRTVPQIGKTDVPLNAHLVVVFSEPVDGATITLASIRLLRAGTPVPGTVRFLNPSLDATHVSVEFVPNAALVVNTEYQLSVTTDVRDLGGDALPAPTTVSFTTGQSVTGPPASIRVTPDSMLDVVDGETYQLTATVLDAAGNVLTDQPVTWSAGTGLNGQDPCRLTVSPTGLLSALGAEACRVTASVGAVSKGLTVVVRTRPASVTVSPAPATVAVFDTILLTATVRDAAGNTIPVAPVTWTSSAPSVASVASNNPSFAIVTGLSQGSATITATSGSANLNASGTATVTVGPARQVASVTLDPTSTSLVARGKTQLSATLRDASGRLIYNRPVTWASDNLGVATVDVNGLQCEWCALVTAGFGVGTAHVTATSGGVSGSAAITVTTLTFASVSTGFAHTCGVTRSDVAWCWGTDAAGLDRGQYSYANLVPTLVRGGLAFARISAGFQHTCGLTTTGAAYCWGSGDLGQLGNGSSAGRDSRLPPVAVMGGLIFVTLSAGSYHSCGVTAAGVAYCWGRNQDGELGIGTTTGPESCHSGGADVPCSTTPVAVAGGLTFSTVNATARGSCGLTTTGAAYCWGSGQQGQLGNGSTNSSSVPVPVSGGLTFSALSAGFSGTTCGVTTSGAAYCWGGSPLGDGTTNSSLVPVAVAGGITFTALSVGNGIVCGIDTGGAGYCWGWGATGPQFGHLVPEPLSGGLRFSSISAGMGFVEGGYACGVTIEGTAYCWGSNTDGQLGNGTTTDSAVPVKVAAQP